MPDPLEVGKQCAGQGDMSGLQLAMEQYGSELKPDTSVHESFGMLHIAAQRGHHQIIAFLLDKGANINIRDASNHTPLHFAAMEGNLDSVKLLVERGADIEATNKDLMVVVAKAFPVYVVGGRTPLHLAAENGELQCVKYLIEKGARTDARDFNGYTPFHLASLRKYNETAEFLNPFPGESLVEISNEEYLWRWKKDYLQTGTRIANQLVGNVDGMTRDCCPGCHHLLSLVGDQHKDKQG
eukprot:Phypoly_transcript_16239.p1 GENE.Phypoly_transcript_16239~~Phypoly_transcript_16239.p1  ORF type:complete len:240 (+),score=33.64 Phypoly_transcript_16239:79-798(+)